VEHAFVRIGEVLLEMADAVEEGLRPFGFYLYTDDVDAVYHRAVAAGAVSIAPPADQPFGDRIAVIQDTFGNQWIAAKNLGG
jgi:PhnB protein